MCKDFKQQQEDMINFATKKEFEAASVEDMGDKDLRMGELMEEHERMKEEMFKNVITQSVDDKSEMPNTNVIYIRRGGNQ